MTRLIPNTISAEDSETPQSQGNSTRLDNLSPIRYQQHHQPAAHAAQPPGVNETGSAPVPLRPQGLHDRVDVSWAHHRLVVEQLRGPLDRGQLGLEFADPSTSRLQFGALRRRHPRKQAAINTVLALLAMKRRLAHPQIPGLWVPIIRSWALTRGFALDPGTRNRYEIRCTRTQHRPPSRQVNDHGRVSGTHRRFLQCFPRRSCCISTADAAVKT